MTIDMSAELLSLTIGAGCEGGALGGIENGIAVAVMTSRVSSPSIAGRDFLHSCLGRFELERDPETRRNIVSANAVKTTTRISCKVSNMGQTKTFVSLTH